MNQGKTQKIKQRIGPIGEAILVSMLVVGAVSFLAIFPGVTTLIAPFIKKKKYSSRQAIQRNVESLVRAGLIKKTLSPSGSVQLKLTKKGRWEAFLRGKSKDKKSQKWDGTWRVVIFDVPQRKYRVRDELRRAMTLYGFKRLQISVWVYPYACDDFIELIKEHLGISSDVLYMKVSYIENDKHLRREFNLT